MLYSATYLASAASTAATLYALGWSRPITEGAFVVSIAAVLGVIGAAAVLAMIARPQRAEWNERRLTALAERKASISSIWGLPAVGFWLALGMVEWVHVARVVALRS